MTNNSLQHGSSRFIRQPGLVLALIHLCVGLVWIALIQPLDAPDEPGHLQAIMQVCKQHIIPEVHYRADNYSAAITGPPSDQKTRLYIETLLPNLPVTETYFVAPYESFQPPLYYLASGLIAQLVPKEPQFVLYVGRLVALLFGAGTVCLCWLTTRELAPQAPTWALASGGVVALLPQFCFTSAHASNDSAAAFAATAAFYVWIRGLRHPEFDRRLIGAGAMVGLAILAKLTALALIPGLVLVIVFRIFQVTPGVSGWRNWLKRDLDMIAGAISSMLLVCGWWFVRNVFTYGEPTGMAAGLRFWTARFVKADFTLPHTAEDLFRYTVQSLWGRFGWNDITLSQDIYSLCNSAAFVLISFSFVAGLGAFAISVSRKRISIVACQTFLIFLVVGLALLAGYLQFNEKIAYMPMARYFFIMILPGALLLTGGLYTFAATPSLRVLVFGILLISIALLNAVSLVTINKAGVASRGVRHSLNTIKFPRPERQKGFPINSHTNHSWLVPVVT